MKHKPPNTKIYALIDPIKHRVFYVGATTKELKERLRHHIYDSKKLATANQQRVDRIISMGMRPLIETLEECSGYLQPYYAEKWWIYQYQFVLKTPLTNDKNQCGFFYKERIKWKTKKRENTTTTLKRQN